VVWTKPESAEARRKAATTAWVLLTLASMILIGIGLARTLFFIWAPEPAMLEKARIGGLYINAGCVLSLAAGVWSHVRGNPVGVSVCVGLPGILVGWAALGTLTACCVTWPPSWHSLSRWPGSPRSSGYAAAGSVVWENDGPSERLHLLRQPS
jgi:hypothetical protein